MDLNLNDLSMMYDGSIVLFKDKPVYVKEVREGGNMHYWSPEVGDKIFKYSEENWKSPTRRIGMVNVQGTVVYVARRPVRKYSVGFNGHNLVVQELVGAAKTAPFRHALAAVQGLRWAGLYSAIDNTYPTFLEAFKQAVEVKGCVAFDKQFAVDKDGKVFYKTEHVGVVHKKATSETDIDFFSGKSYLNLLLQHGYRNIGNAS